MSRELRDPAEYDEASYEVDFAAHCDSREIGATRLFPTEPLSHPYREASERLMRVLNSSIQFLLDHGCGQKTALWAVGFALGHPFVAGRSMRDVARQLGCTKQAISKLAVEFLDVTGLPPSVALKSEDARKIYSRTNGRRKT